jgi:hypothetical protein
MQQAFQAGNVSLNPDPSAGLVDLIFKNYAQPGDQMTVAFNSSTKNISTLSVNTYMGQTKDAVTLMSTSQHCRMALITTRRRC